MKKFYCLVLLALMAFASCKKGELSGSYGEDNGCINRIKRDYSDSNKTELATALKLLQQNNISTSGLIIYRVILKDSVTTNGPLSVYQHVMAFEESKGLPIFNASIGYHFKDGAFFTSIGKCYGTLSFDTKASATLPQVRKVFIDAFNKDGYNVDGHVNASSCVRAEFGYYNLTPDTPDQPHFVKAWKVTFNDWDYPEAYIQDDNRKLLSYFNGIMTVVNANKW
ncbi:hypothetical protein AAFN85_01715 [Mucilaginibacter sp. CAU 1740]|uniref:hypothetical protein n=1 Tax=Mucilaginibacter sp. CAU 1740 TaxID=3140365 RepID=UPI00325C1746